jgi:hypothetical protein
MADWAGGRAHGVVKPRRHETESGFFFITREAGKAEFFRERGARKPRLTGHTPASKHFRWNIPLLVSCPFFAYIEQKTLK